MSGALSTGERALVALSAAVAARDEERLRDAMKSAAREAPHDEVEEILVQGYLFLGYPIALNALALWREVTGAPASGGPSDESADWPARGREVCARVYGEQYEGLRTNVRKLHPDMERWMVEEGYGRVLGRPGVGLELRELCIVALLAVLDAPRQLYSHLRGSLNVGATAPRIDDALATALPYAAPGAARRARETWQEVRARADARD